MLMTIETFENFTPQLSEGVFVHQSAVVIGNVHIGKDSSVWPLTIIRGDIHHIRIGERTSIQDGSVLHVTHDGPFNPGGFACIIGNDVTLGHKVMLHGCTIKDRVLVGMGTIIMDGAVIESDLIIGGGSLVPPGKVLQSGFLYVGSPVKQVRALSEQENSFFLYSAGKYRELKDRYLAGVTQPSC
jgi:carbonic anhydrase/acetyltransferase-like protein (isoleucine patch superfamily)